jgi:CARDB
MRRALMTLLFLLAFPAAADAASVKVVDCVPALDPVDRTATFEARMRPARESERMQVRFTLQVREDGLHAWRRVGAEGFDTWLTSAPAVRRYSYAKTVINLSAPATYRTVVRFRWLHADGAVVKSARITSASCRQPDMRPDLEARRVDVLPGPDADSRRYAVTVRNDGRTDADPFGATLEAGDAELGTQAVLGLAAGTQRIVAFTGPPCTAGAPLTVTLDPDDAVEERDEDDNVLVAPCPG